MVTTIPADLEAFILAEVASGRFASADDAVSEAVRLLRDRELRLADLRRAIDEGITALNRGEFSSIHTEADRQTLIHDIQRRGRERLQTDRGNP